MPDTLKLRLVQLVGAPGAGKTTLAPAIGAKLQGAAPIYDVIRSVMSDCGVQWSLAGAAGKSFEFEDGQQIGFRLSTFGDLKRTFGPVRATFLLRNKQKKMGLANGALRTLEPDDVDVALRCLRGEKTAAQSSKALTAFKHYFASNQQRRKACEAFLKGKRVEL